MSEEPRTDTGFEYRTTRSISVMNHTVVNTIANVVTAVCAVLLAIKVL